MTKQKNWKSYGMWNMRSPYTSEDHSDSISKVQVRFYGSRGHMRQGDTFLS